MRAKLYLRRPSVLPDVVDEALGVILEQSRKQEAHNQCFQRCLGEGVWLHMEKGVYRIETNDCLTVGFSVLPLGLTDKNIEKVEIYDEGAEHWPTLGKYHFDNGIAYAGQMTNNKHAVWTLDVKADTLENAIIYFDGILNHSYAPYVCHQQP